MNADREQFIMELIYDNKTKEDILSSYNVSEKEYVTAKKELDTRIATWEDEGMQAWEKELGLCP